MRTSLTPDPLELPGRLRQRHFRREALHAGSPVEAVALPAMLQDVARVGGPGDRAAPLASTLGREAYDRLLKALSLIYGIESYVVLRDIWGASYREVEAVARFMLEALIES